MTSPAVPSGDSQTVRVLSAVGIVVGIFCCCLRGFIWSRGIINAEVFGYMTGGMFVAGLIASLVSWRSKKRKIGNFGLTFLIVCVLELLLELSTQVTRGCMKRAKLI